MFKKVNDRKMVDFVVIGSFEDENIDNGLPTLVLILVADGLIHQLNLPIRGVGILEMQGQGRVSQRRLCCGSSESQKGMFMLTLVTS